MRLSRRGSIPFSSKNLGRARCLRRIEANRRLAVCRGALL